jgi:hypothetical protein
MPIPINGRLGGCRVVTLVILLIATHEAYATKMAVNLLVPSFSRWFLTVPAGLRLGWAEAGSVKRLARFCR